MKSFIFLFLLLFSIQQINAQQALKTSLKKHVEILASDSLEGRGIGTKGKQLATQYIQTQFEKIGLEPINGSYTHHFSFMAGLARVEGTNILGMIKGSNPSTQNEYIIIGGHYDHIGWRKNKEEKIIFNGADDNASGVATLIETAQLLKNNGTKLNRSIIFVAFDAEESGLVGSEHFLKDSIINPAQIKMMFSVDMVGMYDKNGGLELKGMDLLHNGIDLLNASNTQQLIIKKANAKIEARTDTKSFINYKIPAAHVFTGLKSPYHKPEDTSEKLDYDGMVLICNLLTNLTTNIANEDELLANSAINTSTKYDPAIQWGFKIGAGSSHLNFKDQNIRGKRSFAYETGIYTQVKLTQAILIMPELLYEYSKGKFEGGEAKYHSLTTPVHLMLKTSYVDEYTPRIFVMAGGYYSYHFSEKILGENKPFYDNQTDQDYGFSMGLGFEFQKIHINYNWRFSLNPIEEEFMPYDMIKNCSKLTVGIRF